MTSGSQEVREPLLKRPFDCLLASVGLALSSPLWLPISLAIRLEDGGTVFFTQERCGRDGRPFSQIKFRTMSLPEEEELTHKVADMKDDPRVTKVGKLLRSTALDELPELINILRGRDEFCGSQAAPVSDRGDISIWRHCGGPRL